MEMLTDPARNDPRQGFVTVRQKDHQYLVSHVPLLHLGNGFVLSFFRHILPDIVQLL